MDSPPSQKADTPEEKLHACARDVDLKFRDAVVQFEKDAKSVKSQAEVPAFLKSALELNHRLEGMLI